MIWLVAFGVAGLAVVGVRFLVAGWRALGRTETDLARAERADLGEAP